MTKRSATARRYPDRIGRVPAGPLAGSVLLECSDWLAEQGYSSGSAAGVVNLAARLSVWMQEAEVGVEDLDEHLLARFVAAESARAVVCGTVKRSMGTLRRFLRASGYLAVVEPVPVTPVQVAIGQWRVWMREQRGLAEKTIDARCYHVDGLLERVVAADGSVCWDRLDARVVNEYVTERGRPFSYATRVHIIEAARTLVRWAVSTGRLDRDISAGILKPARVRRCLPKGATPEQVAALLSACDPSTAIGARDRAIVLIFTRLGLRAGEAARLCLDDIDWRNGQLRITGKGREHLLPIPVDVGQALTDWLRLRPEALDRAVFVRMKAPRRAMTPQGISGVIGRLSGHVGIGPIHAHRLRHTAAIGVLAAGGSLAEARELLGHAYLVTTMGYAKVDLASLRELVVPFGQVPR